MRRAGGAVPAVWSVSGCAHIHSCTAAWPPAQHPALVLDQSPSALRSSSLEELQFYMTPHSGHTGAPVRVTEGQKKRWRDYWTHTSFHCSSSFCSFSWAITSLQWLKDLSLHTSPASLLFSAWRSSNTSFWIKQTDHCLNVTKKGLGHISRKSTEQIILCIRIYSKIVISLF